MGLEAWWELQHEPMPAIIYTHLSYYYYILITYYSMNKYVSMSRCPEIICVGRVRVLCQVSARAEGCAVIYL